jgi:PDZ domain
MMPMWVIGTSACAQWAAAGTGWTACMHMILTPAQSVSRADGLRLRLISQTRTLEDEFYNCTCSRAQVPPGCSRYCVRLQRPLGLILEEDKDKGIVVAEVVPGGAAERTGCVSVGDTLISTSGQMYTKMTDYGGTQVCALHSDPEQLSVSFRRWRRQMI